MGSIIGSIIAGIVDELADLVDISRENIVKKIRDVADRVERGDVVPEEALARAHARQKRVTSIRDRLPGG